MKKTIFAALAVLPMAFASVPVANSVSLSDNNLVLGCIKEICGNRVNTAQTISNIGDKFLDVMYAADSGKEVYVYDGDDVTTAKTSLNFSEFKGVYSKYVNKPIFNLPGNFSPALGAVVAATRGGVVSNVYSFTKAKNFNASAIIRINGGHIDSFSGEPSIDNGDKITIKKVDINGDDSSVSAQVANFVWPNNQGAKHVYYIMPNNVDAVSAGMFGDGPVIVLGANGSKPQGAFNNLPAVCVGGPACSAPGMENAEKIIGKDRYETNYLVNKKIFNGSSDRDIRRIDNFHTDISGKLFLDNITSNSKVMYRKYVIIASADDNHIVDSATAGVTNLPVMIIDNNGNNPYINDFISLIGSKKGIDFYASGGPGAISHSAISNIRHIVRSW